MKGAYVPKIFLVQLECVPWPRFGVFERREFRHAGPSGEKSGGEILWAIAKEGLPGLSVAIAHSSSEAQQRCARSKAPFQTARPKHQAVTQNPYRVHIVATHS